MMSGPFFIVSCPITGTVIGAVIETITGIICVNIAVKCSRWFQRRHYLRHYRGRMLQIVLEAALTL